MTTLPDIPRLYTALTEVLAAVLYAQAMDFCICLNSAELRRPG